MKKLLLIPLFLSSLFAQSIDDYPVITGANATTSDYFAVRDADGTTGNKIRRMTLGELVNVPELFGSAATKALIDDDTFATATSTNIPSAESVKAYVDANSGTVDNAAVVAAIEEDPAAAKVALGPEMFVFASDYLPGAANATAALQAAVDAVAGTGKTLVMSGTWTINDEIVITGSYPAIKIYGYGATIVQTNTAKNALTLSAPVSGVIIEGLTITGQGSETHDAAGIYLRKGDLSYIGPDYFFRDMTITGFRQGTSIANVTTLRMDCVSVGNCRIGHDWYLIQTGVMTQLRVNVAEDSNPDPGIYTSHPESVCFNLSGGPSYGLNVIGGEYGSHNKFLKGTGQIHIAFDGINVEAISSGIIMDVAGGWVSLRNSKIQQALTDTGAVFSYPNTGASYMRFDWANNFMATGSTSSAIIEMYGTGHYRGPQVTGEMLTLAIAETQGGARSIIRAVHPEIQHSTSSVVGLPSDGSMKAGQFHSYSTSATGTDTWSDNVLLRQRNNHTGTNKWSSVVNDMLFQVLGVTGRTASGNNVETDIQNVTLPIGALRNNGESVDIELFGTTAANANDKHFRFYFNGTAVLNFGALPINAESWTLKIRVQRGSYAGGSGYQKIVGTLDYGSGRVIKTAESTADSATTIATRVTVLTPTAASDAVSLAAKTTWTRAVPGI